MLTAFRILAALLALQASGFAHLVADAVFHDDGATACDGGGSDDEDGSSDCPPGCPTCHACAHTQAMYVPRGATDVLPPEPATPSRAPSFLPPPVAADRDSIYRPPRV